MEDSRIAAQALVGVGDRLRVVLALGVHRDLVHRAGPVERVERDEVVELVRAHLLERLAHALGLELEHAGGVAAREHLIGARVIERQPSVMSGARAGRALDDVQRVLDHVEVAQPEEVHLQHADVLDRLHRELRDRAERPLAVLVGACVGELQRARCRSAGGRRSRPQRRGSRSCARSPPGPGRRR